ncbi:hypothetical protein T06_13355 [Trichinella sp. T6]|nr:hypothetical protein T06_13355 [Trichinella sp. T6]
MYFRLNIENCKSLLCSNYFSKLYAIFCCCCTGHFLLKSVVKCGTVSNTCYFYFIIASMTFLIRKSVSILKFISSKDGYVRVV